MSITIFTTPPAPDSGPLEVPDPIEPYQPQVEQEDISKDTIESAPVQQLSGGVYGYEKPGRAVASLK